MAVVLCTLPVAQERVAVAPAPARDLAGLLRGQHAVDQCAAVYGETGFSQPGATPPEWAAK